MKLTRSLLALALTFSLSSISFLVLPLHTTIAQDSKAALQRGYRTGYSDGFMAGYRDTIDSAAKDFRRHSEYSSANRAYNRDYGSLEDYQDGYRQGFEAGYETGFEKRSFESTVPSELKRRGESAATAEAPQQRVEPAVQPEVTASEPAPAEPVVAEPAPVEQKVSTSENQSTTPGGDALKNISFQPVSDAVIIIPRDTELIVELGEVLTTDKHKVGDAFTAKVVSPTELSGAVIEGRIERIEKPGRIKRRSEMLLSFDRIVLTEDRWSNFDAILTEVLPVKGDNIKRVDGEGTAVGSSSIKPDAAKVAGATGAGAGIGAIAGGPVGAAVGAGVGAAFGVGAVIIERGKHIRLIQNQQLRIKTSYETRIR